MFLIRFQSEDEDDLLVAAEAGENLLKVAKRGGVPLNAPCSGSGSCGKCRVRIASGTLDSPKSFYISDVDYEEGWRLACVSRVNGDAALWLDAL